MTTTQKWLTGCGLGCAAVAVIVAGIVGGGFFFGKRAIEGFQRAEETARQIEERFGAVSQFRPEPDGHIDPERLECFLRVRQRMAPIRTSMEERLERLASGHRRGSVHNPRNLLDMLRAGAGVLPALGRYFEERNRILLEEGMGLGEHLYLYTMVYLVAEGHPPGDGPPFMLMGDGEEEDSEWDEEEVRARREQRARGHLNQLLLPMLRRQRDGLAGKEADGEWGRRLAAEIEALGEDPLRIPWEEGLPLDLARSLEPYRERLVSSYATLCNPIEIGPYGH